MDDLKIEREMFKALSLLHSTDESSGKNLRLMLDSLIEEKFGFQKTVTSRISKAILTKAESCGISVEPQNVSSETIKIFKTESEHDDIPRISIPDEGSEEGVFHMENESNLGAFILFECQNCLENCQLLDNNNKSSIDIDDFNKELTWLCEKCSQHGKTKKRKKKI
ncbi:integrator complex subunit 12-like [Leptopilina boulardi]|uniref:integrator complex subunit 12-like n=1 Tax=Leptopilina boulardi TaxID=63433 RepID=UPI0021F5FBD0|nr:integrator complex subunit 12-like [Leptopilina boulardi]XP_051173031.1 integrator complex subunit 12-like [Leptopilina boulardi]